MSIRANVQGVQPTCIGVNTIVDVSPDDIEPTSSTIQVQPNADASVQDVQPDVVNVDTMVDDGADSLVDLDVQAAARCRQNTYRALGVNHQSFTEELASEVERTLRPKVVAVAPPVIEPCTPHSKRRRRGKKAKTASATETPPAPATNQSTSNQEESAVVDWMTDYTGFVSAISSAADVGTSWFSVADVELAQQLMPVLQQPPCRASTPLRVASLLDLRRAAGGTSKFFTDVSDAYALFFKQYAVNHHQRSHHSCAALPAV